MYTINNKTKQITLTRGDTFRMKIEIISDGAVYIPTANDAVRFSMKRTYASNTVLIHKDLFVNDNDEIVLTLSPNDTKTLPFGSYVYDVEITFSNGDVDTFISGRLKLVPEVE